MDSQRYPCNLELNNNVKDIFAFPGLKVLCSDTARLVRQNLVGYRCELCFAFLDGGSLGIKLPVPFL